MPHSTAATHPDKLCILVCEDHITVLISIAALILHEIARGDERCAHGMQIRMTKRLQQHLSVCSALCLILNNNPDIWPLPIHVCIPLLLIAPATSTEASAPASKAVWPTSAPCTLIPLPWSLLVLLFIAFLFVVFLYYVVQAHIYAFRVGRCVRCHHGKGQRVSPQRQLSQHAHSRFGRS